MTALPETRTLRLGLERGVLHVWLARPEAKNALTIALCDELEAVLDAVAEDRSVRVLVLRGEGGNFCAGGDVKEMAVARVAELVAGQVDPLAAFNRRFGAIIQKLNRAPQATVAVLEGAVLGGGLGLACAVDIAIARADAAFGLPETGLGIPPAQIAPFLVQRLGVAQTRRLAVTGARFDCRVAASLGLVHEVAEDDGSLDRELAKVLAQIRRCAPGAIAHTKAIVAMVGEQGLDAVLDEGAARFAAAVRGGEAIEGMTAFVQRRLPNWAEEPA